MTGYQTAVLWGLWILIKLTLKGHNRLSGTEEVMWAKSVVELLNDERFRNI